MVRVWRYRKMLNLLFIEKLSYFDYYTRIWLKSANKISAVKADHDKTLLKRNFAEPCYTRWNGFVVLYVILYRIAYVISSLWEKTIYLIIRAWRDQSLIPVIFYPLRS